ncbi:unnamed protein product [Miscanthus lutarioriparius]|uniref:Uncharacterized protein n=1 Tax=Miscanthus lutarioriparius TaxID=422564 RepID=A0A811R648_9POAL|nr:unnamed protein product [Miscanthus lutarioriparius]
MRRRGFLPLLPLVLPAPAASHGLEREQQHGESGNSSLVPRSGQLRKWNERWVILDPTTGKIEYKYCNCRVVFLFAKEAILELHRKRNTFFEQKLPALQEHEYPLYKKALLNYRTHNGKSRNFLRDGGVDFHGATQLVLQAHKEAVNSLGENGPAKLGTVATVVAVANATAIEATKEVEAAMKISLRATLGSTTNKLTKGQLDDLTIMMDIRARDSTINEIEEKLQETAEAAETAASAARSIDEERRFFTSELERFA